MPTMSIRSTVTGGVAPGAVQTGTPDALTLPTGLREGDLYGYAIALSNNTPSGFVWPDAKFFTVPGVATPVASGASTLAVALKRASANESSTPRIAWTNTSTASWIGFAITRSSGLDGNGASSLNGTAATSHASASLTPSQSKCLLVTFFGTDNVAGQTVTYTGTPTGMTKNAEKATLATASCAMFSQTLTTASATGAKTATASSACAFASISLLFAPATSFILNSNGLWVAAAASAVTS